MRSSAVLLATCALVVGGAKPADSDRRDEVSAVVFDLCPRVFAGELSLTDPAQLAAIGFTATPPRQTPGGEIPRAEKGAGAAKLVIAGHSTATDRACSVWFGGPDNKRLLKHIRQTAAKNGYAGGAVLRLGDGTGLAMFRRTAMPTTLTIIEADAGGEMGLEPATAVIYIAEKAN